jgi:hypothetical protein
MTRLAFASLAAVALYTVSSAGSQPALRLRIQALGQRPAQVRVTLTAAEAQGPRRSSETVDVETPAVLPIADSIQSIHIVVSGFGAVRVTLTDSEKPGRDMLMAEGRDFNLSRDAQGRFYRTWTATSVSPRTSRSTRQT